MSTLNHAGSGLATQVAGELYTRHSLQVNQKWLSEFLSGVRTPLPPIAVLVSTAHFRLLNSDITKSLVSPSSTAQPGQGHLASLNVLPRNINDVNCKSMSLQTDVPVQLLFIEDIGTSKGNQIEAIERYERGEEVRGREIIRNIPIMNELQQQQSMTEPSTHPFVPQGPGSVSVISGSTTSGTGTGTGTNTVKKSQGPHKLLVQDAGGTKVYAFELIPLTKIFITNTTEEGGISIGCKLLFKRGCTVRRGVVMLSSQDVVVLGGKIEEWDTAWRKGRKERLVNELKTEHDNARSVVDELED